jgi:hypothetical protein
MGPPMGQGSPEKSLLSSAELAWAHGQAGACRESILAYNFVCPCTLQHLVWDFTIESLFFIPVRHE